MFAVGIFTKGVEMYLLIDKDNHSKTFNALVSYFISLSQTFDLYVHKMDTKLNSIRNTNGHENIMH